jgi:transposase
MLGRKYEPEVSTRDRRAKTGADVRIEESATIGEVRLALRSYGKRHFAGSVDPEESLHMPRTKKQSTEAAVREIRRRTRRKFAPEEKIRIVLEGLRGEQSISELCRREGIAANLYYRWSKDFLEAGKKQLAGDTVREATSDEVKELRAENSELKEVVAEITLKNRVLKKSLTGLGEEDDT